MSSTKSEMIQAEQYVFKILNWNLSYVNSTYFLQSVSKAGEYNIMARIIAQYLTKILCLEWRLLSVPPLLLACMAICPACLILNNVTWVCFSTGFWQFWLLTTCLIAQTPYLSHCTWYAEFELTCIAKIMINYILKPIKHKSFYKKYLDKKYFKMYHFLTFHLTFN